MLEHPALAELYVREQHLLRRVAVLPLVHAALAQIALGLGDYLHYCRNVRLFCAPGVEAELLALRQALVFDLVKQFLVHFVRKLQFLKHIGPLVQRAL